MNFNEVHVVTVAKVGSSNFLHVCKEKYKTYHTHSLLHLKNILKNKKNILIIVGIRNPVDRNLSYLFQTFRNNFYNTVCTKKNNYKGENAFISDMNLNSNIDKIIELFFQQSYHYTFNDWFQEFFDITNINQQNFDKKKGMKLYKLSNNNTVLIYTMEKLNDNKKNICELLNISNLTNINNSQGRDYKDLYNNVKKTITYKKTHLDSLLQTSIMNFFYTKEDIQKMYSKYKITII